MARRGDQTMSEQHPEKKTPAMKDGIIKRGTTWAYVIREPDPETGKSKPRWFSGFPTRDAAKKARDKARVSVTRGTYVAPSTITVGEWLDKWMSAHSVELKPSTIHGYQQKIDMYLKPTLGTKKVQALSPSMLSTVFREMGEAGGKDGKPLSPRSVEYARSVLRKAMNDAVVDRLIEINPVTGSKAPRKQGKPKHTTWTGDEQRRFLDHVADTRWSIVWQLALATGMRRGELCALTWARIDLDEGVVSVEQSTTQIGRERVTTDTKNHESRKVNLDPRTITALKAWRKAQTAERLKAGPLYSNPDDLVLTWQDGSPVQPDYLSKEFVDVQAGLELPRMTLHGCRHTHATTLLREGVPVHIVSKRLGHRDPSVTLNVYADAIPADDTRAVDVFARAVWGA